MENAVNVRKIFDAPAMVIFHEQLAVLPYPLGPEPSENDPEASV